MTSTAVLAQADSVATWISAIGGLVGTIATITVAVIAYRWDRQRDMADRRDRETERRNREAEQARLVAITVDYSSYGSSGMSVTITNHSEQQVRWPRIESISDAQPPVRWGDRVRLFDEDGEEYGFQPAEVLLPHTSTYVPYEHFDADGRPINLVNAFFTDAIKRYVRVNDVTITFDMFGARWWRTGNGEPVQVVQPAPAD